MKTLNFKKNIPNIATIFRIIIIIPIVIIMILAPLYKENIIYYFQAFDSQLININTFNFIAFILFVIASITD
jgi:phosphatidylglycerophosphate synthase